ncbi:choice-of-anchor I family protein [Maribellus sediminis]|uniref:choice-of-anchor I family protein n=1 Tax=Maribellus sediminis TaxID=2696285 RepID=UPI00142F8C54|nr:choice-of-anchor I family protein [Maribellus sediminis]
MKKLVLASLATTLLFSCTQSQFDETDHVVLKSGNGKALGQNDIFFTYHSKTIEYGEGAAEISAYDPASMQLFVVNNAADSKIDVFDLSPAGTLSYKTSIAVSGGGVNSVAVKNGMLAAALEADVKTDPGSVAIYDAATLTLISEIGVGALPDMVTFTPDGNYILSANEGEPNDDYDVDPEGTVSIIEVSSLTATTLGFSGFASQAGELMEKGLRIFGPNASFAQDIEPEYITVSEDSKTAWVSLQENNALAKIDIETQTITDILPLGFKDYSLPQNPIDPSDENDEYNPGNWPAYGIYMPDAIAVLTDNAIPYVFTANEGDSRDYPGFSEEDRVKDIVLDATVFPNYEYLQEKINLGRLKITTTLGNLDDDEEYEALYSYGARSFSVWDGNSGDQVFDSRDELDVQAYLNDNYEDGRSDDKSTEPEGVVLGTIGNIKLLFVGMERVDAVAVYDVTNPRNPKYLQWLKTGDAPEGLAFVSAEESPTGTNLLLVSSENDGVVTIFTTGSIETL